MKPYEEVCGCAGKGVPVGESSARGAFGTTGENRPLYQLAHLVAMLERQEEQRRQAQAKKGDD
jgi:hypothetical protein